MARAPAFPDLKIPMEPLPAAPSPGLPREALKPPAHTVSLAGAGRLIALVGPVGIGKTTLARRVQALLGADYTGIDDFIGIFRESEAAGHPKHGRKLQYEATFAEADRLLRETTAPVVIETGCTRRSHMVAMVKFAQERDVTLTFLAPRELVAGRGGRTTATEDKRAARIWAMFRGVIDAGRRGDPGERGTRYTTSLWLAHKFVPLSPPDETHVVTYPMLLRHPGPPVVDLMALLQAVEGYESEGGDPAATPTLLAAIERYDSQIERAQFGLTL